MINTVSVIKVIIHYLHYRFQATDLTRVFLKLKTFFSCSPKVIDKTNKESAMKKQTNKLMVLTKA